MDNGCPKCKALFDGHIIGEAWDLCIDCQIEQAEYDILKAMNRVEELKKEREKQNESSK